MNIPVGSHSIFILQIHQYNVKDSIAKCGKLYLVDLAGSEKISKTGATGLTLDEGKNINLSLTTLGMVINSLTDGKSNHVPYRNSKLTRVLQESLGGNAKTCLIIAASPSPYNEQETLGTLRFGERAKKIKNKPKINKEVTVAELKAQVEKLEKLLHTCSKRISQLENFITKNKLQVPSENDYSYMNQNETTEEVVVTETTQDVEENTQIDSAEQKLHEMAFHEKITNLLENNRDLNDKLDDAFDRIDEFKVSVEEKEKIIKELSRVKENFDLKEYELQEKICELQEKLDLQKNAVRRVDPQIDEVCTKIEELINNCNENGTQADEYDENNLLQKFSQIFNSIKDKMISKGNKTINNTLKQINFENIILNDSTISIKTDNDSVKEDIKNKKFDNEKALILKSIEEKTQTVKF
jgi:kinesin family protein 5